MSASEVSCNKAVPVRSLPSFRFGGFRSSAPPIGDKALEKVSDIGVALATGVDPLAGDPGPERRFASRARKRSGPELLVAERV